MTQPASQRVALILAALGLGVIATLTRIPASARFLEVDGYEDRYYLPTPAWLEVFSLGHREALADLLWIRTLVYYGDELGHQGPERHIFDYAEAILALDPDFRGVYARIGTLALYRASDVTAADAERAASLMQRGVARFPDDGQLAWRTGATLAFEIPPLYPHEPARQDDARARAAPYLIRAVQLAAAPPYAMFSNASLLARIGRSEEAATHLEEMYAVTSDPAQRAEIAAHIEQLRTATFSTAFVEENRRFEDDWGRLLPYAPATLYDLVRPIPVIDTTAVLRDGFGHHALDGEPALE